MWVHLDDDRILVSTEERRVKARNVRRDPRVALSIHRKDNPYSVAFIRGRVVEMAHDGADEFIDSLAKKYLDQERYPFRQPGDRAVTLVIEPERVATQSVY